VMSDFRRGTIRVLVATTVIEVGVDVPAATMMLVEHAERFGLSQIHQLRGRVGRGDKPGVCYLFTQVRGGDALHRLRVLCQTRDGFRIAEEDLRLRGPGELIGVRQHGMPLFKAARLSEDFDLLQAAQEDAARLLDADPDLEQAAHRPLRREVMRRYGQDLMLIDVA